MTEPASHQCSLCLKEWHEPHYIFAYCGVCGHLWESIGELIGHDYNARMMDQIEAGMIWHDTIHSGEPPTSGLPREPHEITACPCCHKEWI
jgi:hypothetical protein